MAFSDQMMYDAISELTKVVKTSIGGVAEHGTSSRSTASSNGIAGLNKALNQNTSMLNRAMNDYRRQLDMISQFQSGQAKGSDFLVKEFEKFSRHLANANNSKDTSNALYRISNIYTILDKLTQANLDTEDSFKKYIDNQYKTHDKSLNYHKNLITGFTGSSLHETPEDKFAAVESSKSILEAKRKILNAFNADKKGVVQIQSFLNLLDGLNLTESESTDVVKQMFGGVGISKLSDLSSVFARGGQLSTLYKATGSHLPMDTELNTTPEALAKSTRQSLIATARQARKKAGIDAQSIIDETPGMTSEEASSYKKTQMHNAFKGVFADFGLDYEATKEQTKKGNGLLDIISAKLSTEMKVFAELKHIATLEQTTLGKIEQDISGKLLRELKASEAAQVRAERQAKFKEQSIALLGHLSHEFLGFSLRSLSLLEGGKLLIEAAKEQYKMWSSRTEGGVWQGPTQSSEDSYKLAMNPQEVTQLMLKNKNISDALFNGHITSYLNYIAKNQTAMVQTFGSIAKAEEFRATALQSGSSIGTGRNGATDFASFMTNVFTGKNQPFGLSARLLGMTGEQLNTMTSSLISNDEVQRQLLGLNKQQRYEMSRGLVQRSMEYKALGLSTHAAEHAALAMSKFAMTATPKQRLAVGAALAQGMSILGMNPSRAMQVQHDMLFARQLNSTVAGRAELQRDMFTIAHVKQGLYAMGNKSLAGEILSEHILGNIKGFGKIAEELNLNKAKALSPEQVAQQSVALHTQSISKHTASILAILEKAQGLSTTPATKAAEGIGGLALSAVGSIASGAMFVGGMGIAKKGFGKVTGAGKSILSRLLGSGTEVAGGAAEAGGLVEGATAVAATQPELWPILAGGAAVAGGLYGLYKGYEWLTSSSKKATPSNFSDKSVVATHTETLKEQEKYHTIIQTNLIEIADTDKQSLVELKAIALHTENAQRVLEGVFNILYDKFVNTTITTLEKRDIKSLHKQTRAINGLITPV